MALTNKLHFSSNVSPSLLETSLFQGSPKPTLNCLGHFQPGGGFNSLNSLNLNCPAISINSNVLPQSQEISVAQVLSTFGNAINIKPCSKSVRNHALGSSCFRNLASFSF